MHLASHPVALGISSCLLGEAVRYDGNHRRNAYVVEHLARHIHFVAFCPEVAIGLGVPRAPIDLVHAHGALQVLSRDRPDVDLSGRLKDAASRAGAGFGEISGYLFKSRSPSCGLHDVPIWDSRNCKIHALGKGVYADAVAKLCPALPAEDEARLKHPALLANFLERVYAYHAWRALPRPVCRRSLARFHREYELNAQARSADLARQLNDIVCCCRGDPQNADRYIALLMSGLRAQPTMAGELRAINLLRARMEPRLGRSGRLQLRTVLSCLASGRIAVNQARAQLAVLCASIPECLNASAYLNPYPYELVCDHAGEMA